MQKVAVLNFESGDWQNGFSVTLQIGQEGLTPSSQKKGRLPKASDIESGYRQWQLAYLGLPLIRRLEAPDFQVVNVAQPEECQEAVINLETTFNHWLNGESFLPLRLLLHTKLHPSETIRFIIQTDDILLRQLPWHLWDFFNQYRKAEITFSPPCYEQNTITHIGKIRHSTMRILAILGNSEGINLAEDRRQLENLPNSEVTFLVEPSSEQISEKLWDQQWDILFFAGHSGKGKLAINPQESISPKQLKLGLSNARHHGLHLAILNSCDGLELAQQLEELQIPQMIVMREPVPDLVAQKFLMYFLKAFSQRDSIYLAMRKARERLAETAIASNIPGSSGLPVMCQNLAAVPLVWPKNNLSISIFSKLRSFKLPTFKLPTLFLSLLVIILGTFYFILSRNKIDYISYKDKNHKFVVQYPANWKDSYDDIRKETQLIAPLAHSADQFQERLIINQEFLPNDDIDQISHQILRQITKEYTDMLLYPSPIQINNIEARQAIYSVRRGELELTVRQVWLLKQGQFYRLKSEVEKKNAQRYTPIFQTMIDSFEFTSANQ